MTGDESKTRREIFLEKEIERLRRIITDKSHEWVEYHKELWRLVDGMEAIRGILDASLRVSKDDLVTRIYKRIDAAMERHDQQ